MPPWREKAIRFCRGMELTAAVEIAEPTKVRREILELSVMLTSELLNHSSGAAGKIRN